MSLIVHDTLANLAGYIEEVIAVENPTIRVLNHEDLFRQATKAEKKKGKPIIGLVYMGLQGLQDKTHSGAKSKFICDVYFLGLEGDAKLVGQTTKEASGLTILDHTRNTVQKRRSPGHTIWQFVHELPVALGIGEMEFVQRWATVVPT